MSGGSYADCDGYYEPNWRLDNDGKMVYAKPDNSRFLAQMQDGVWACYKGPIKLPIRTTGGWFVKSMY